MVKKQLIIDPDLDVITEIGQIAVAWGRLEYSMKLVIKRCLGREFSEGMLHAERRRQFSELLKELRHQLSQQPLSKEARGVFDQVLPRIEDLNEKRQDVIHSSWTVSPEGRPRMWRTKLVRDVTGAWVFEPLMIDTDLEWLRAFRTDIQLCWRILNSFFPPKGPTDAAG